MNVLVTGGAGYIGSHAALALLEAGHEVTVVDDLSRGHARAIDALRDVGTFAFVQADFGDRAIVEPLLREREIELVMHFAALALVGESVEQPLLYYRNNAAGTLSLVEAIEGAGVRRVVFSSTCATYGAPEAAHVPIAETCPQQPINPYGHSKLFAERVLVDYAARVQARGDEFAVAMLRYFNVAGADPGGRLGEDHRPETHLVPICLEAALGQRDALRIFGTDYPTPDGTCVRDYVHVSDLVDAHLAVTAALAPNEVRAYNVGIGRGYSVREVIESCQRVTGVDFPVIEDERRPGDPPELYAAGRKVVAELGWSPRHADLDEIVETAWRWKQAHPRGYAG